MVTPQNTGLTQLDGLASVTNSAANSGTAFITLNTPTANFTRYFLTTRESGAVNYLGSLGQGYRIDTVTAAIPEPQSWALMIIGFGLVGIAARRRKASVAA